MGRARAPPVDAARRNRLAALRRGYGTAATRNSPAGRVPGTRRRPAGDKRVVAHERSPTSTAVREGLALRTPFSWFSPLVFAIVFTACPLHPRPWRPCAVSRTSNRRRPCRRRAGRLLLLLLLHRRRPYRRNDTVFLTPNPGARRFLRLP